ncbi:MAG: M48 metallopeptidase family protein [Sciscionella sp.]
MAQAEIEVRRSRRRHRTVSAYRDGDTIIVMMPAGFSKAEEQRWVADMVAKLQRSETRRRSPARASDTALMQRCAQLGAEYFPAKLGLTSVRWVPPMRTRWASCTPTDRSIRISERLRAVPSWVLDYVLVHELAHLFVAAHNAEFWAMVEAYPRAQRAIGYLEGLSAAGGLGITDQSHPAGNQDRAELSDVVD